MNRSLFITCIITACLGMPLLFVPSVPASAQSSDDERAAVPTASRQAEIAKLLDDTYGISRADTAAKKQQTAKDLTDAVSGGELSPDEQYVVLITITRLSREAGDFTQYWYAVRRLGKSFQGDATVLKEQYLIEFLKDCKVNAALKLAVDEALVHARLAALEHHYPQANSLLDSAEAAIRRTKTGSTLAKTVAESRKLLTSQETQWRGFQNALARLATDPSDATANFTVGRWHALHEEDWEVALPFLVKGSDAKWKSASELDLKEPNESTAQMIVGDAWWDIAQAETADAKSALLAHAREWYEEALPGLASLQKQRIAKRLSELAPVKPNSVIAPKKETATPPKETPKAEDTRLPIGQWIDLLPMVKLPDHRLEGNWQRRDRSVFCEPSGISRLLIPVAIRGSYELKCDFTRHTGDEAIVFICPLIPTSCSIVLSADNGKVSGLELIEGKRIRDISASTGAVARPGRLTNGRRYQLHIDVTRTSGFSAVTAKLDGQAFIAWNGQDQQLTIPSWHTHPCPQALAVNIHSSSAELHSFELRLKRGTSACQLGDDWDNPILPVADAPPKQIISRCITRNGHAYYIGETPTDLFGVQLLAAQLQGRMLTISSADEDAFIQREARGKRLWTSAWRRIGSKDWRDERNRPLRYIGKWGTFDPSYADNELFVAISLEDAASGWFDAGPHNAYLPCIEWGEEYPGK